MMVFATVVMLMKVMVIYSNSETSDENHIPKKGTALSSRGFDFGSIYIVKLKDHDRRLGSMRITTTYPTNK